MNEYLEIGEAVATHGIRGDIKLYPWSDSPSSLLKLKTVYTAPDGSGAFGVEKMSQQRNMILMKLAGVDSVEDARHFIGRTFYAPRTAFRLGKGKYFVADIIGLRVEDAETGRVYGTVADVLNNGAHDYYEIRSEDGCTYYMPAIGEFIAETDIEGGRIAVRPIRGMFGDED